MSPAARQPEDFGAFEYVVRADGMSLDALLPTFSGSPPAPIPAHRGRGSTDAVPPPASAENAQWGAALDPIEQAYLGAGFYQPEPQRPTARSTSAARTGEAWKPETRKPETRQSETRQTETRQTEARVTETPTGGIASAEGAAEYRWDAPVATRVPRPHFPIAAQPAASDTPPEPSASAWVPPTLTIVAASLADWDHEAAPPAVAKADGGPVSSPADPIAPAQQPSAGGPTAEIAIAAATAPSPAADASEREHRRAIAAATQEVASMRGPLDGLDQLINKYAGEAGEVFSEPSAAASETRVAGPDASHEPAHHPATEAAVDDQDAAQPSLTMLVVEDAVEAECRNPTGHFASDRAREASERPAEEAVPAAEAAAESEAASGGERAPAPVTVTLTGPTDNLRPAWEVDFFRWPEITSRLLRNDPDSFDALLHSLGISNDNGGSVVAVTGSQHGEGRSTVAVCLARRATANGFKTLLVDADLARPDLVRQAGLDFHIGWCEQGPEQSAIEESLVRCTLSKMTLMPCGRQLDSPEPLSVLYDRLQQMVLRIKSEFDVVIIDAGLATAFAAELRPADQLVNAALLVQGVRGQSPPQLVEAYRALTAAGIRSIAIAENFGKRMAG